MTTSAWHFGLEASNLSAAKLHELAEIRRECAGDIVTMTTLAACGHPGGSLSSLDMLLVLYGAIRHRPSDPLWAGRDRVIVSHGHISPGVYSVLAAAGYFDREAAIVGFRIIGSPYGGHVESHVPGVEWNTGNLGQGLSAGCGAALAAKLRGDGTRAIVLMGDGEQQKGQIAEARRFARKFELDNLIAMVDVNHQQIGGRTESIMPQNIRGGFEADGWRVLAVDGHDQQAIYKALRAAWNQSDGVPTVILAETIMGKGVSLMEAAGHGFHGKSATRAEYQEAIAELGVADRLDEYAARRAKLPREHSGHSTPAVEIPEIQVGPAISLAAGTKTDCRSAYGKVLEEIAKLNNQGRVPKVLGISCDLEGSVKMNGFHDAAPRAFLETGISEHHAAVLAGRLSREGFVVFYSTFGIFAVSEGYNQQRLNDYNGAHQKIVATHCGLDVGEDGPTHQVIDTIALMSNLFETRIFFPADPNQCDRIIRHVAVTAHPAFVGMGRSKIPTLTRVDGTAYYDQRVPVFTPGVADVIREGDDGAILALGAVMQAAVEAHDLIKKATGKRVRVLNMASVKPIDREAILAAATTGRIVTVEDHNPDTGMGSLVANILAEVGAFARVTRVGVNAYGASGDPGDLYRAFGLDAKGIARHFIG